MAADRINLSLSPELKERWLVYCNANDCRPSEAFAEVIRKLTNAHRSATSNTEATCRDLNSKKCDARIRLELRLTRAEHTALAQLAVRDGFSTNRWVVALVRHKITNGSQFGSSELIQLAASNSQLLAIGRNLNQIARALNAAPTEQTGYRVEVVEALSEAIKSHTAAVSAVIQSNVQRWSR